jgi:hypothetical protein
MPESTSCPPCALLATCNTNTSYYVHANNLPTQHNLPVPTTQVPDLPPTEPPPTYPAFPAGSIIDHIFNNPTQPCSPARPFEFPCDPTSSSVPSPTYKTHGPSILRLAELPSFPLVMDSITQVVGSPRVFGLRSNGSLYVQVKRTACSLIDGGANICLTGNLNLLVDVVDIKPLPISVAVGGEDTAVDNSCTQQGYLPLTLSDGSTHWQLCFYCKNAIETIISPQAILANSDVFASWMQTGFKDGRPGQISFDSHDGLATMRLDLDCWDGLYYCPTDVFTVDKYPVRRPAITCSLRHHPLPPPSPQPLVQYTVPDPTVAIDNSTSLVH